MYAISERLKQPRSPLENSDKKYDFSHVLDFNSHLKDLTIKGNSDYGTSNLSPSSLSIELSTFKSVSRFMVDNYPVYNMGNLRDTVEILKVYHTILKIIRELTMCEEVHKHISSANDSHVWLKVIHLDLSFNQIEVIDEAIKLLPHIELLILNNNRLTEISNVTLLPRLSQLHLVSNNFTALPEDLHTKIGKNYVSCNKIENIQEVKHIGTLPCLKNLRLTGNPVSTIVDYRIKVLEPFGKRAADIYLDSEKPNQQELDTVSVFQALRIAKEGKSPTFSTTDAPLFSAEIPPV